MKTPHFAIIGAGTAGLATAILLAREGNHVTIFEQVDEWTSNKNGCSVSGILHFSRLQETWWQNDYTSLILYPDAIVEKTELPFTLKQEQVEIWTEAISSN